MNKVKALDVMVFAICLPAIAVMIPPTLSQSREKVHRARCLSNMKTLWGAFRAFARDHDGHLPATGRCARNSEFDWTWGGNIISVPQTNPDFCQRIRIEQGSIWQYVYGYTKPKDDSWYADARKNVYLCPTAGAVGMKRGLSYSMNSWLEIFDPDLPYTISIRLAAIKNSARTVLLVEESELTINDGWFIPTGRENDVLDLALKHSDGGHLLFCDGHIGWIHKSDLLELMNNNADYFRPEL